MGTGSSTSACYTKVTVVWDGGRLDVALPSTVPVADLLPEIIGATRPAVGDSGARNSDWCLARLAHPEPNPSQTLADLRIRDGDVLELRPRGYPPPEIVLDDPADAVGHALTAAAEWDQGSSRIVNRALGGACLALAAAALLIVEAPAVTVLRIAVAAVVVLVIGALALARTYRDPSTGLWLGAGAVVISAVAGARAVLSSVGPGGPESILPAVGVAGTASAVVAGLLVAATRTGIALYAGAITAGVVISAVSIATAAIETASPVLTIAAAVVVTAEIGLLVASKIAMRLAGLPRLQELAPDEVRRRAERAGNLLTGLFGGLATSLGGGCLVLLSTHDAAAVALAATASALLVFRTRRLRQRRHVVALLVPAALGLAAATVVLGIRLLPSAGLWVPVLLLGAASIGFRRLAPDDDGAGSHPSRVPRVAEALLTAAQLPLAALVVGVPALLPT
jgi:type VII secretion integral membrane protein EccD